MKRTQGRGRPKKSISDKLLSTDDWADFVSRILNQISGSLRLLIRLRVAERLRGALDELIEYAKQNPDEEADLDSLLRRAGEKLRVHSSDLTGTLLALLRQLRR